MKRILILMCCVAAVISPVALATTVGFAPLGTARTVVDSLGVTVPTTGLVMVGNFVSEGFTFNPLLTIAQNVAAITLAGTWERFGVDTLTDATNPGVTLPGLTINGAGKIGLSLVDGNGGLTQAAYFNNKSLYLWIFNASTVAAATEMGIFRSTDAANTWVFPVHGTVGDNQTYSTAPGGAPTMLAIGGTGSTPVGQMKLAAVPEPSVLSLGAMAGLGMLASRKRRQRK